MLTANRLAASCRMKLSRSSACVIFPSGRGMASLTIVSPTRHRPAPEIPAQANLAMATSAALFMLAGGNCYVVGANAPYAIRPETALNFLPARLRHG